MEYKKSRDKNIVTTYRKHQRFDAITILGAEYSMLGNEYLNNKAPYSAYCRPNTITCMEVIQQMQQAEHLERYYFIQSEL